ncbi:MAG: sensor histidine kinase [Actinobacteria bacterium]|nr:sensor histidine kinase [Actinomycetota bacterium]
MKSQTEMHRSHDSTEDKSLSDFIASLTSNSLQKVEEKLGYGFVKLKVAEAERRQAYHDIRSVEDVIRELVRNSRDAGAHNVLVGFQKEKGRYRRITVLDDGCGVPGEMHSLIFEPRVTSRCESYEEDRFGVHGRGMALFSIKSRVEDIKLIASVSGSGTSVDVKIDTAKLPEKSDQASIPQLYREGDDYQIGSGTHNVNRLLLEISIDLKGKNFYVGSFAEVASTLYGMRKKNTAGSGVSIWKDIYGIRDAKSLSEFCTKELGLAVSERNAYRILNGEIPPLDSVFDKALSAVLEVEDPGPALKHGLEIDKVDIEAGLDKNRLKMLKKNELEEIGEEVKTITGRVIEKYYLRVNGNPKIRKGRGKIVISLYVSEEDE